MLRKHAKGVVIMKEEEILIPEQTQEQEIHQTEEVLEEDEILEVKLQVVLVDDLDVYKKIF